MFGSITNFIIKVDPITFQQYYEFTGRISLELFQDLSSVNSLDAENELKTIIWEDIKSARSRLYEQY